MAINPFAGGTIVNNLLPKLRIRYPKNWVQSTSIGHLILNLGRRLLTIVPPANGLIAISNLRNHLLVVDYFVVVNSVELTVVWV